MLCPIKVNSNTIELTVHSSCYCVFHLLCVSSAVLNAASTLRLPSYILWRIEPWLIFTIPIDQKDALNLITSFKIYFVHVCLVYKRPHFKRD